MTTATSIQLSKVQYGHARDILAVVHERGLSKREAVITIAVALAESQLKMTANVNNAESLRLSHDAVGSDNASVGLFQQQVPGWGTTAQLMDTATSCKKFLNALAKVDWVNSSNWVAAQDVQNSAYDGNPRKANNWSDVYGGNYKVQDDHAAEIVNAIWHGGPTRFEGPSQPNQPTRYWVDIFERAPVFSSPGAAAPSGQLYRGRNFVLGKRWGKKVETAHGFNHWWLKTVPDEGTGEWVSAYFLTRWGNDEAKDNDGVAIANC